MIPRLEGLAGVAPRALKKKRPCLLVGSGLLPLSVLASLMNQRWS